ncbi:MAG: nucleotidyltransferase family protein [Bacteroidales bacterium]|nr:nucleotidyltransferase family protein [Bacteroidales bacterium]
MLRNALWNRPIEGWKKLSPEQWKELVALAKAHTLAGTLSDALNSLPEDCDAPSEVLEPWLVEVQRTEEAYALHSKIVGMQRRAWEERGLKALLLKGLDSAAMYSVPEHRTCGDIDWYFGSAEDWKTANEIAAGNGCKLEMDSDGDVHYTLSGVVVEHHRRWNDASSARARRVIDALPPETPEAQLIMRNVHILKHAMVGGIGLRQLCDLAMAYRHYDGQYDPASLTGKLREAGLGKWNGLLNAFLVQVIGCEYIDKDDKVTAADLEWLVRAVLDDGNFGRRRQSGGGKPQSGALVLMGSAISSGKPQSGALTLMGSALSSGKPQSGALALMGSALSRGVIFMKYAPCEYIARIRSLVKGRMKRKIKNS